jgi:hypothetical protein
MAIWLMNGAAVRSAGSLGVVPLNWLVLATGDYNGDGKRQLRLTSSEQLGPAPYDPWTLQSLNAEGPAPQLSKAGKVCTRRSFLF